MDTKELQEAAERLHRVKNGEAIVDVHDPMPGHAGRAFLTDKAITSDGYLAEHPADDAEPVTEEWLEKVGFSLGTMHATILANNPTGGSIVELVLTPLVEPSTDWEAALLQGVPDDPHRHDDHVLLTGKYYSARGDVRRLCEALGIALKESK